MKVTIDVDAEKLKLPLQQYKEKLHNVLIRRLQYIGEECISIARNLGEEYGSLSAEELEARRHVPHQPNYIDDTGNLRQSIGYIVAYNGDVIQSDLKNSQAETLAMSKLSDYPDGYVLIMVAGMEYAVEVSAKGYDVLDSAAIAAKKQFTEYLKKIFK